MNQPQLNTSQTGHDPEKEEEEFQIRISLKADAILHKVLRKYEKKGRRLMIKNAV
jgi:hypothetical protein